MTRRWPRRRRSLAKPSDFTRRFRLEAHPIGWTVKVEVSECYPPAGIRRRTEWELGRALARAAAER